MTRQPYDYWPAPTSHVAVGVGVLSAGCALALALLSEPVQLLVSPPAAIAVAWWLRRSKRRRVGPDGRATMRWGWYALVTAAGAVAAALPVLLFRPGPAWIMAAGAIVLLSVEIVHRKMRPAKAGA